MNCKDIINNILNKPTKVCIYVYLHPWVILFKDETATDYWPIDTINDIKTAKSWLEKEIRYCKNPQEEAYLNKVLTKGELINTYYPEDILGT